MKKNKKIKNNFNSSKIKNNLSSNINLVTAVINSGFNMTTDFIELLGKQKDQYTMAIKKNKNRLYKSKEKISRYSIFKSFKYAGQGLYWAFVTEPNIRIQMAIGIVFFGINLYFGQLILAVANLIFMAMTCSFEINNTIIENICDYIEKDYQPKIKIIKDMAAGAVLVVSLVWLLIIIFGILKISLIIAGIKILFGFTLAG